MEGIVVSIIIVNYNSLLLLQNCLSSIYEQTKDVSFEILVSDNGSSDGSLQMVSSLFPEAILIENKKNIGFGAANNRALALAKGKYIFYLNNDTVLNNNAVKLFVDYFESHGNEHLGAIGCTLCDNNGNPIHSSGSFASYKLCLKQLFELNITNSILSVMYVFGISPNAITRRHKQQNSQINPLEKDVDFITGADLFLRNDQFAQFDERYFLYFEDSTLQYKMMKNHLKRRIIVGPEIYHLCGGSAGKEMNIMRKISFSRIQFEFSRIQWIMDRYGEHSIYVLIAKLFVICAWIHPCIIFKTARYIKSLLLFNGTKEKK